MSIIPIILFGLLYIILPSLALLAAIVGIMLLFKKS